MLNIKNTKFKPDKHKIIKYSKKVNKLDTLIIIIYRYLNKVLIMDNKNCYLDSNHRVITILEINFIINILNGKLRNVIKPQNQ